jgi:hypothetical protein
MHLLHDMYMFENLQYHELIEHVSCVSCCDDMLHEELQFENEELLYEFFVSYFSIVVDNLHLIKYSYTDSHESYESINTLQRPALCTINAH